MEKKTEYELLIEKLGEEYFKDMSEEQREKMLRLIVYMMMS
ncbi:hypothetical protein OXPF_15900 [Oxobacter pfennigii]|uniref:Uncharacterized protein n=1 Tax=Oxobacter pfennigii TaxID=36849 RepID=A0A0P8W9W6_9CLOT|nr:hypothetical protein [Oxobacter pfennigii]KPU44507.1 hypothetical protein OXPF_15900 [Oxobacter pfennigii]